MPNGVQLKAKGMAWMSVVYDDGGRELHFGAGDRKHDCVHHA